MSTVPVEHELHWDWPLSDDEFIRVADDDDHFEVGLSAKYFAPNEIEVKAIGELLEIHLEHKARKDDKAGMVSRSINRCYKLPQNVDVKTLKSNLDNKGILHIAAQKKH